MHSTDLIAKKIDKMIEKAGFAIISKSNQSPVYQDQQTHISYTVGLSLKGQAEIMVAGMNQDVAMHWIWKALDDIEKGVITPGDLANATEAPISEGYYYRLIDITDKVIEPATGKPRLINGFCPNLMLSTAAEKGVTTKQIRILYLTFQDKNGLYPWQEGAVESYHLGLKNELF